MRTRKELTGWKLHLYEIIFEADTKAGRMFDIILLLSILTSVLVVMLESVSTFSERVHAWLYGLEWFFTILFSLEYIARLLVVLNRKKYIFSFFGIVDLISILPMYLVYFIPGSLSLLVIRSIRLLRIFRILKLVSFVGESQNLIMALRASRQKIIVFVTTVTTVVIISGTLMFLVEGPEHGFSNIPISLYWAIVTMTTVGYGDISPQTPLGQAIASLIMIMGYAIIAVPTGIVSAEMMHMKLTTKVSTQVCPHCLKEGHEADAAYCKYCGEKLN